MKGKKETKKNLTTFKLVFLFILVIIITAGVTSIIYSSYKIIDFKEYPIYLKVSEDFEVGFDIRTDSLSFGKIPAGGSGIIKINIKHNFNVPLKIIIKPYGKVKDMIVLPENYFILEPGISKQIEVLAVVPEDMPPGEYEGKLKIFFIRP
ncbi:hypothetical protein KY308_01800 [Candidatus Woesearchaeota archaeon]|nr:hypothetical protein [Candidatus Woesearchaeota archaeon]